MDKGVKEEILRSEKKHYSVEQALANELYNCRRAIEAALEQQYQLISLGTLKCKAIVAGFIDLVDSIFG